MYLTLIDYWTIVLLLLLVTISISIYFIKDLLHAVIVYGAYSLIMALIWLQMNTPDLAITEAAAGICTTVLMMVVVFRTSRKEEE
ncbi:MAG: hydrogenase subunit MbhD domain-containing protein [Halanaerobiales bacterium]